MARGAQVVEEGSKEFEAQLLEITKSVTTKISGTTDKDALTSYAKVLSAIADVENSLPRTRQVTFSLTRKEATVLLGYAIGGLLLMYLAQLVTPGLQWKGADAANLMVAWSAVVAVILGAQALPQILGGGSSGKGGGGGGGGGAGGGGP